MAERKAFLLRIDPELWAELEGWAQAELRSVNGQVEYLLREAVQRRRTGSRSLRPPAVRRTSRSPLGPDSTASATPAETSPPASPPPPSSAPSLPASPPSPPSPFSPPIH